MPPPKGKAGGVATLAADAGDGYDASRDPPIAVIIADSFTDEMRPLTQHRPRALLPVANVPLIEYALEMLVVNGIKEVRIITYFGSDQIRDHLESTITYTGKTWLNSTEIQVKLIAGSSGIQDFKSALIDANDNHHLPERFLLLPVDTLSTCRNLATIYHNHARRARADPNVVLTVAVSESTTTLRDAHRVCVERAVESERGPVSPTTNASTVVQDWNMTVASRPPDAGGVVETNTDQEYVTIAYQPQQRNVISGYQSWPANEVHNSIELAQLAARDPQAAAQAVVENRKFKFDWNSKSDTVVRSDLINTGILVVSQGFVSDVLRQEAMVRTLDDMLRYFVDNPGYCTVFAALEFLSDDRGPSSHSGGPLNGIAVGGGLGSSLRQRHERTGSVSPLPADDAGVPTFAASLRSAPVESGPPAATIQLPTAALPGAGNNAPSALCGCPNNSAFSALLHGATTEPQPCYTVTVRSPASYITASIAVCERRLFPYTRESNFADNQPLYSVWRFMPNVYAHAKQGCRLGGSMALGPNVVIGEDCCIAPTAIISGSVIGNRVTIGRDSVILASVVLDDAVIGDGVVLSNCAVGASSEIAANGFNASGAVIGDGVQVRRGAVQWPPNARVYVPYGKDVSTSSDLVGPGGVGCAVEAKGAAGASERSCRLNLEMLFARDVEKNVDDGSDDDGSEPEDPNDTLYELVLDSIDSPVQSSSAVTGAVSSWKMVMLHHARTLVDLNAAITRALIVFVARHHKDQTPKEQRQAICAQLKKWVNPVYRELLPASKKEQRRCMFGTLIGLCLALNDPACQGLRSKQGSHILACMYSDADDALFEEDGHCIVSLDAIVRFDNMLPEGESFEKYELNAYDPAVLDNGWECFRGYVDRLQEDE